MRSWQDFKKSKKSGETKLSDVENFQTFKWLLKADDQAELAKMIKTAVFDSTQKSVKSAKPGASGNPVVVEVLIILLVIVVVIIMIMMM